ncbi:BTAD domain-containing putative transcriptional regulator [Roseisolibacter sp. H3M3-2]|uniref:BTAD domain-containing putative transcriptional regulator n=1 Tax=Roseisolibacter sp. H3M3-2 TaxID=3031323 RepID=UPI0023DBF2CC|nr:BTAD domain-containing putative transcriptional regulator [Roseisolibacter sp. H3M3-2]MDF1503061.1 BTAD domain-containing putative transcriptional regulator [Roseisolibacter sp. H3M3-2]
MTTPVTVRLLGGLSIETAAGRPEGAGAQPRRLALLAIIARAGERGVAREKLLAMLWPDAEPEAGRRALNQAVYALRRDVGAGELVDGVHALRLNPDVAACDVLRFEAALRDGRLEEAATLYDGPFLDGFRLQGAPEFDRWADEERRELAHRMEGILERLAKGAEQRGAAADAARWWRKLAAVDPLDARVATGLMRALVAGGDVTGALQHARIYEVLMQQELDLPADAGVVELARRIRAGELTPSAAPAPTAPTPTAPTPTAPPPTAPPPTDGAAADGRGVAVLPFVHLGDVDREAFTEGVSEEVLHALGEVPGVRVAARSASFAFRGSAVDLAEVGARLGVGLVVEGSVRHCGVGVRVTARLVDVATGQPLAAERVDAERSGDAGDSFALQDAIAARVVARVVGALPSALAGVA